MNPALALILVLGIFVIGIGGVWAIGMPPPITFLITVALLAVLVAFLVVLLFLAGAFQFSGRGWFWKLIRILRKKGALDYIWQLKVYKTGGIRIDFDKIKENSLIRFGNEPDSNQTQLGEQHHYEVDSRLPCYPCIEGIPMSVNLNQTFTPSDASRLINQATIMAHIKGKLEALGILENLARKDVPLYGMIIIIIIGLFVLGWLSMGNNETIIQGLADINASLARISTAGG